MNIHTIIKQALSRFSCRSEHVIIGFVAGILLIYNMPFWSHFFEVIPLQTWHDYLIIPLTFIALIVFFSLFLALLMWPYFGKVILIVLLLGSASTLYFMQQYGVVIDSNMIQNVFQTDTAEVRDLITFKFVLYMLGLGVLPSYLIACLPIRYRKFWREILVRLVTVLVLAIVLAGSLFAGYRDLSPLVRNNRDFRFELIPMNYIQGMRVYFKQHFATPTVVTPIGLDAKQAPVRTQNHKPNVLILVVGETARADHFQLNGYARATNPELSKIPDLINLGPIQSCGTETAVSLPCMFSDLGRNNYSATKAQSQQNLLDVLTHAGLKVVWVNNNSGCKGVCKRTEYLDMSKIKPSPFCSKDECYDEIMLEDLPKTLADLKQDAVIVLHQKGSHGPAYYKRYPSQFEQFKPVCKTSELQTCQDSGIINAYDNTILYTDHFLAQTISLLRKNTEVNSAMLYLSDHGESLGENNLYLHGMPYAIAPDVQKTVPMLMWLSPAFQKAAGISEQCVKQRPQSGLSQDYLFSSVLGLMRVETNVYNPKLDMLSACHTK